MSTTTWLRMMRILVWKKWWRTWKGMEKTKLLTKVMRRMNRVVMKMRYRAEGRDLKMDLVMEEPGSWESWE